MNKENKRLEKRYGLFGKEPKREFGNKLNLGCGSKPLEGFINVDLNPMNEKILKVDLEQPLPFENNYFNYVFAENIFEHIFKLEDLLKELHRICKEGAEIEVIVPHRSSLHADGIGHITKFRFDFFKPYTKEAKVFLSYPNLFEVKEQTITFNKGLNPLNYIGKFIVKLSPTIYEETFLRNIFLANEIHYKLEVVK